MPKTKKYPIEGKDLPFNYISLAHPLPLRQRKTLIGVGYTEKGVQIHTQDPKFVRRLTAPGSVWKLERIEANDRGRQTDWFFRCPYPELVKVLAQPSKRGLGSAANLRPKAADAAHPPLRPGQMAARITPEEEAESLRRADAAIERKRREAAAKPPVEMLPPADWDDDI